MNEYEKPGLEEKIEPIWIKPNGSSAIVKDNGRYYVIWQDMFASDSKRFFIV